MNKCFPQNAEGYPTGSPKLLILNGAEEGRIPDLRIANANVGKI
jgi:hypothetical protein